ncbi:hypothetical protein GQ600_4174 [Phytophthora cactorum]|nr:hypothetical protein GQ600_4174 [Phytophthora cactorum]
MQIPVTVRTSKKTPSRSASKGSRNSCLHSAAVGTELGGGDDEDAEPCDRGDPGALVKGYIRHLSFDKAEEDNSQYLEVRSHASLDKITELDDSRQRRVTVAEANSEEEESNRRPPSSYDSEGDWSLEVQSSEDDSAYGSDYMDTGFVSDKSKNTGRREAGRPEGRSEDGDWVCENDGLECGLGELNEQNEQLLVRLGDRSTRRTSPD